MLCITGLESTLEDVERRIKLSKQKLGDTPHLHELRVDALRASREEIKGFFTTYADILLVCCRPKRQGGQYDGAENIRLNRLRDAAAAHVAYLDVEADLAKSDIESLKLSDTTKLIVSWHDFRGLPADMLALCQKMRALGADIVKLAVSVREMTSLKRLLDLNDQLDSPTILIAMGENGVLSRIRYYDFGSPWTYICYHRDDASAPGQLCLDDAMRFGMPDSTRHNFCALVGGPQVKHSWGPDVYNAFFKAADINMSYVAISSTKAEACFDLMHRIGAKGLSVTMPFKKNAYDYGLSQESASHSGAANTLFWPRPGMQPLSYNTDIQGVKVPLAKAIAALPKNPRRVLILGAGGVARAAVLACRELDLTVLISARRFSQAADLSTALSTGRPIDWSQRDQCEAEILINATPCSGSDTSPWPEDSPIVADIVFDLAITGQNSLLVARAKVSNAIGISAQEMWLAQGARQISIFTGTKVEPDQLRSYL